ncbi:unnamed protein product [Rhizopus stolonifer]
MSNSTELPKNSISFAIFGLQDTLSNIKQQWKPLEEKPEIKQPNELHALDQFNSQHCSQFETEVLGNVMKMGVGADPAFRKHFTHLKEQASLESTVIRLKDILHNSKELLEKYRLVTFVDDSRMFELDSPTSTITLGGTLIVIDIDIDDKGGDDRVDNILTENLQSRNFDLFKRNLWSLALLDQLNIKYKPLDFFSITKNLLQDLKETCLNESEIEPDFLTVLTEGHGVPCLHLSYPGISLAYWLDKSATTNTDWNQVQESFQQNKNHPILFNASKLLISFENSVQSMHYPPPSRPTYLLGFDETEESVKEGIDGEHFKVVGENNYPKFMSPTRYIKTLSTHPDSVSVPIRFVATVEPPIPMADQLCQNLMNVVGLVNEETTDQNESKNTSECLSLEEILVPNIGSTKQYTRDNHVYKWMKSSITSAKMVSRIPFQHPVQIYNILQCLRQQQMFNALFKSIFNEPCTVNGSIATVAVSLDSILTEKDEHLIVEVAATEAPYSIHLTLSPPQASSFILVPLSIDIPTEDPTRPTVSLHASPIHKWNMNVFKSDAMTKELQSHHNLPQFIRWLFERMSKESFVKREKMDIDDDLFKKSIKIE